MLTIHKWPLATADVQSLLLPRHARILTVQAQKGRPMIWALVDDKEEKEKRQIFIVGTGHEIRGARSKDLRHVGTFQLQNGELVFHVFEETSGT